MEEQQLKRLNKYLSELGYCSRRAADKLIEAGRVQINGTLPQLGQKVSSTDEIAVDGKLVSKKQEAHVYLAFNKPVGVVCTTELREPDNIIDFIGYHRRIFPIGRLDKPSEGLILLTSDGDVVNKILRSKYEHEKEYIVTVNKNYTPDFLKRMAAGVPILDEVTKKCRVEAVTKDTFRIVLTQGLNRQIRRMCEFFGYEVTRLKRVRIMNIKLLNTPVATFRELSKEEVYATLSKENE